MRKPFAFLFLLLVPFSAHADYSPRTAVPPIIAQMDTLPGAGELKIDYCLVGHHGCVTVETSCHGSCCSQFEADEIGYGCSGDIYGVVPPLYHYAGWSCRTYDNGKMTMRDATPNYDRTNCHNPR